MSEKKDPEEMNVIMHEVMGELATIIRGYDGHIGWSLMFYPKNNYNFSKLLQPYILSVFHNFTFSTPLYLQPLLL